MDAFRPVQNRKLVHNGTSVLWTRQLLSEQGIGGIVLVRAQVLDAAAQMVTTEFWHVTCVAQNHDGLITGAVIPLLTTPALTSVSGLAFVLEATGTFFVIRATAAATVGYKVLLTFGIVEM